jgi:hypothetical protein
MEFERPAIFKNKDFFQNTEEVKEESSITNFQNKDLTYNPIDKIDSKFLESVSNEMTLTKTIKKPQSFNKYVGIKNLKLIEDISKFVIINLYSVNFKSERLVIFTKLSEILDFIEHSKARRECLLEYKEEIIKACSNKIDIKFLDYIFKMLEININEYRRFYNPGK